MPTIFGGLSGHPTHNGHEAARAARIYPALCVERIKSLSDGLPSGHSFDLGDEREAEAQVIVPVVGVVVVAVRHPAVVGVVVPGAAAVHAVRAFGFRPTPQI